MSKNKINKPILPPIKKLIYLPLTDMKSSSIYSVLFGIVLLFFVSSCNTYKTLPYFHDFADTASPTVIRTVSFKNPVIQPDDILNISIETMDQDVTAFLNKTSTGIGAGNTAAPVSASQGFNNYIVDKNGEVELPFTGKVRLEGLTTSIARDTLTLIIGKYFNNPVVNVRFANFKVSILGEINRPGSYIVPNEKVNVFDALSLGGDITVYGKKENVLLLRDTLDGVKKMVRLNLDSKDIVSSPYFYLRPNDLLYIEPNKYKVTNDQVARNRSILTVALVLILRFIKFF